MAELMKASNQWMSRPADERFVSLHDMLSAMTVIRDRSRGAVVSSRTVKARPVGTDHKGLEIIGGAGVPYAPTEYAFGQLATLAGAPAGYLRSLPSEMAADCINYGLQVVRDAEDIGLLLYKNGESQLRAATGPRYGRIWNEDIVRGIVNTVGDGVNGSWRVPGEFGKAVEVTKANTTLYAGDRDMFVFLADEENRVEMPDRRNGRTGSLARGFFCWNSEVGDKTFGFAAFLFDYVCCNRIVWGAREYRELKVRHTAAAPDRFQEEALPALERFAERISADSTKAMQTALTDARSHRLANVDDFLADRFGPRQAVKINAAFEADEQRPIETRWDAVTGVTAFARTIPYQDTRVALEREAGKLLDITV